MNTEYFLIFVLLLSGFGLLIQRTELSKRRVVLLILLLPLLLLRNFAVYREVETEALTALWVALFLNFLFWLFVGRYNPVGSSDNIRVMKLDD